MPPYGYSSLNVWLKIKVKIKISVITFISILNVFYKEKIIPVANCIQANPLKKKKILNALQSYSFVKPIHWIDFNNFKVDVDNFHSPCVSKGNYLLRRSCKDRVSNMAPASSLATIQKKQL